jgi:hypothetical protein
VSEHRAAAAQIISAIREDLHRLSAATTPSVREVRRRYSKTVAGELPQTVLAVAGALVARDTWPERLIAYELVAARADVVRELSAAVVERWAKGLADWGSVDLYGVTLAGVAWRQGIVSEDHVMRWARSPIAGVAVRSRRDRSPRSRARRLWNANRTLQVCRVLVEDRDDIVVKALSWALRAREARPKERRAFHPRGGRASCAACPPGGESELETGRRRPEDSARRHACHLEVFPQCSSVFFCGLCSSVACVPLWR